MELQHPGWRIQAEPVAGAAGRTGSKTRIPKKDQKSIIILKS
jgi:hypothetical protein